MFSKKGGSVVAFSKKRSSPNEKISRKKTGSVVSLNSSEIADDSEEKQGLLKSQKVLNIMRARV